MTENLGDMIARIERLTLDWQVKADQDMAKSFKVGDKAGMWLAGKSMGLQQSADELLKALYDKIEEPPRSGDGSQTKGSTSSNESPQV